MSKTQRAIENNIDLCHTVALAHGVKPLAGELAWRCDEPMPQFYPNLITRLDHQDVRLAIAELASQLPSGWGLKDSFSNLDLSDEGFRCVMSGAWFCTNLNDWFESVQKERWQRVTVTTEEEFAQWLAAWDAEAGYKVFPKGIWQQKNLTFLYVSVDQNVIGGCLLNQSSCLSTESSEEVLATTASPVVGLSNWFGDLAAIRWGLSPLVSNHTALMGYTHLDEITKLQLLGFERLSNMRVWVQTG